MNTLTPNAAESQASKAFSTQAPVFDAIYAENTIVTYKRQRVRAHFMHLLAPGSNILELNAGTGDDAIYFAQQGHRVHATDIAVGMQQQLRKKAAGHIQQSRISTEICSYTDLANLKARGPYDAIFSNFGGLNCTPDLDKVLASFSDLLKPGGVVTMVIIPKFCLWEALLIFKGKFRTATRRWFARNGCAAHIEGVHFTCWYYSPSEVIKGMKKDHELVGLEGLCTIVPPSYIEGFAQKHPRIYQVLKRAEGGLKTVTPFKHWGDYFIISFKKRL